MIRRFFLLSLSSFLLSTPALCWWETGHQVVGEIAWQRLSPLAKQRVEALVTFMGQNYPVNSLAQLGPLPDYIKEQEGWHHFDSWHYITRPYDPDNILTDSQCALITLQSGEENVVWAISHCLNTLSANPDSAPNLSKAMALTLLTHFVADAHQPLHAITRFGKEHPYPTGDMGGNYYQINSPIAKSLHALWDQGCGLFKEADEPPLQPASIAPAVVQQLAKQILSEITRPMLPDFSEDNTDPADWASESYNMASLVYSTPQFETPSDEYLRAAQEASKRRIALAGYRLGAALNRVLGTPNTKENNNETH